MWYPSARRARIASCVSAMTLHGTRRSCPREVRSISSSGGAGVRPASTSSRAPTASATRKREPTLRGSSMLCSRKASSALGG